MDSLKAETLSQLYRHRTAPLEWTLRKYLWNAKECTASCRKVVIKGIYQLWLTYRMVPEIGSKPYDRKGTSGCSLWSVFPCQSKLPGRGSTSALLFSKMKLFRGEPYLQEIPVSLFYCYPPTVMTSMGLECKIIAETSLTVGRLHKM